MAWMGLASAGLGAAATLGQSLFGKDDGAIQQAILNYRLQKQQADQQYELGTAGQTNARGDRTEYTPGLGWRTTPTETTRGIIGASDREERARLTEDQPRARRGREDNATRRGGEGALANALLRQMQARVGQVDPATVTGRLAEAGAANINDKADFAKNAIGMHSVRSGMGSGDAVSQIDASSRGGLRSVLADARLQGPVEADTQNQKAQQGKMQPYNMFATRASNVDDVPFAPSTQNDALSATLSNQRLGAGAALGQGSAAMARGNDPLVTALMKKQQPNYGAAIGSFGGLIEQLLRGGSSGSSKGRDPTGGAF